MQDKIKEIEKRAGVELNPRCEVVEKDGETHLYLEGRVSSGPSFWEEDALYISAKFVRDALKNVEDVVIHLNSPGGSVFEGVAIYNTLKDHQGKVTIQIDGLAASIATVICMGADVVRSRPSSIFMIHRAWTMAIGNPAELRKTADMLDKIDEASNTAYMTRFNGTSEELGKLLDDETYLSATDAYAYGFIDELIEESSPEQQPTPKQQPTQELRTGLFKRFKAPENGANLFAKFTEVK